MLAKGKYEILFEILSNEKAKFAESFKKFNEQFTKFEYFRVGWILQHFILQKMLTVNQRLVGHYILYEMYLNENVKTTPFYQMMLDLLKHGRELHTAEAKLLNDILKSVPRIASRTPKQYIQETEETPPERPPQNLDPYQNAHSANMPLSGLLEQASVLTVLIDGEEEKKQKFSKKSAIPQLNNEELQMSEFVPTLMRPFPITEESYLLDDAQFLTPGATQEVLWDFHSTSKELNMFKLVSALTSGTASHHEEMEMIRLVKLHPEIIKEIGINPDSFPSIAEYNPDLAIEIFKSLNKFPEIYIFYINLIESSPLQSQASIILRLRDSVNIPKLIYKILFAKWLSYIKELKEEIRKDNKIEEIASFISQILQSNSELLSQFSDKKILLGIEEICSTYEGLPAVSELSKTIKEQTLTPIFFLEQLIQDCDREINY